MVQKKGSTGKDFLNWCRSKFVSFLDRLYSKDDRIIICGSSNGRQFYGCPREIYEYLIKECAKEFDIYYYLTDGPTDDPRCLIKGGNFNWKTIKIFLRAKTLIGSHGVYDFGPWGFTKKKIFINTWHGFPLKTIAFSSKFPNKGALKSTERMRGLMSALLASSEYEAELFSKCFRIEKDRMWIVGQPRNDRLVDDVLDAAPPFVKTLPTHRKLILYCPTFRDDSETKLFPFEDFDLDRLNKYLEENGLVILLRTHINEGARGLLVKGGRIIDLSFNIWPDINSFLPNVDLLITDYSSIYFDFLLLDRPLVFVPYDLEHYEATRGFMVDDYDKWTPGPKVKTFNEFLAAISDQLDGKDAFRHERAKVSKIVNAAQSTDTPRKVIDNLRKLLSKGEKK